MSATAEPTTTTTTLPLLPLSGGVVFPEMVVTIELESDEARQAAAAARADHVLLVPRHDDGWVRDQSVRVGRSW